jgi:hypothetical protein
MGQTNAALRGKFIAKSVHIKRTERSQLNDLTLNLKLLEKQEQAKSKTSRRSKIIKIGAEINELEMATTTKKNIKRINGTKAGSLKK